LRDSKALRHPIRPPCTRVLQLNRSHYLARITSEERTFTAADLHCLHRDTFSSRVSDSPRIRRRLQPSRYTPKPNAALAAANVPGPGGTTDPALRIRRRLQPSRYTPKPNAALAAANIRRPGGTTDPSPALQPANKPCNSPSEPLLLERIPVLFDHRVRKHFSRNAFHLSLRLRPRQTPIQGDLKILPLAHLIQPLVTHLFQCTLNGF